MTFIHTADWQIGKPFAGIGDAHKRSLVQQERVEAIKRISGVAQEHGASFVLVAGDLFDSSSALTCEVCGTYTTDYSSSIPGKGTCICRACLPQHLAACFKGSSSD